MKSIVIRAPEQLSEIIRATRKAQKRTQADLAARLGITTQSYSVLERQVSKASLERVHRLCLLLRLDLAIHMHGDDGKPRTQAEW